MYELGEFPRTILRYTYVRRALLSHIFFAPRLLFLPIAFVASLVGDGDLSVGEKLVWVLIAVPVIILPFWQLPTCVYELVCLRKQLREILADDGMEAARFALKYYHFDKATMRHIKRLVEG